MRTVDTDVAWSLCLCVCLLDTFVSRAKTAEPIEVRCGRIMSVSWNASFLLIGLVLPRRDLVRTQHCQHAATSPERSAHARCRARRSERDNRQLLQHQPPSRPAVPGRAGPHHVYRAPGPTTAARRPLEWIVPITTARLNHRAICHSLRSCC